MRHKGGRGDGCATPLLAALEAQRIHALTQEYETAFRPGEADGVLQHGRQNIGPSQPIKALRRFPKERQCMPIGRRPGARSRSDSGLRKLGQQRPRGIVGFVLFEQKPVVGRAQRNLVVGAQARRGDADPVDESAVAAAGIAQEIAVAIAVDQRMGPGNFRAADTQVAVRTAAQREGEMIDGDGARPLRLRPLESQAGIRALSRGHYGSLCVGAICTGDYAELSVCV